MTESAGGVEQILQRDRAGYFRYLQLLSQVYGVLKIASEADIKVSCDNIANEVENMRV